MPFDSAEAANGALDTLPNTYAFPDHVSGTCVAVTVNGVHKVPDDADEEEVAEVDDAPPAADAEDEDEVEDVDVEVAEEDMLPLKLW